MSDYELQRAEELARELYMGENASTGYSAFNDLKEIAELAFGLTEDPKSIIVAYLCHAHNHENLNSRDDFQKVWDSTNPEVREAIELLNNCEPHSEQDLIDTIADNKLTLAYMFALSAHAIDLTNRRNLAMADLFDVLVQFSMYKHCLEAWSVRYDDRPRLKVTMGLN